MDLIFIWKVFVTFFPLIMFIITPLILHFCIFRKMELSHKINYKNNENLRYGYIFFLIGVSAMVYGVLEHIDVFFSIIVGYLLFRIGNRMYKDGDKERYEQEQEEMKKEEMKDKQTEE